jgi:regulatory protein
VAGRRTRGQDHDCTPPPPPDAYEAAVRLLALRPHGEVELRRKLARRGCEPEAIDEALARARRLGYLDDAAFARALVAVRAAGRGPALIAAELAAKGVARTDAAEALAGVSPADQVAAARRLAARTPSADRRAVAGRLHRRGFTPEVVRAALDLEHDQDG